MANKNFNLDSQPDFNQGLVEIDGNRTDYADPELGNERLFIIPGSIQHLGGLGILKANLDTLDDEA